MATETVTTPNVPLSFWTDFDGDADTADFMIGDALELASTGALFADDLECDEFEALLESYQS